MNQKESKRVKGMNTVNGEEERGGETERDTANKQRGERVNEK